MLSNLVKVTQLNWEVRESRNWDLNLSQQSPQPGSFLYAKLQEQTIAKERNKPSNTNNMVKSCMERAILIFKIPSTQISL